MLTSQLIFVTRNKDLRKVRSLNFKRFKHSAFLILFFLSFGLTQSIAKADDNSSNLNDQKIDRLDCKYEQQVRLFNKSIYCIYQGYKLEGEDEITPKKRAKTISDNIATFAESEVNLENLFLTPCNNNSKTCFHLSYRNQQSNQDGYIDITSINQEDIKLLFSEKSNKENQDLDLEKEIQSTILASIKKAVINYRESQCQLTNQAVAIESNGNKETLFCIKTRIRDRESISERSKRITQRIKDIQEGDIHVETLEIVKVSDLKDKFGISEYEKSFDSNQEKNSDKNIVKNQFLALVSNQQGLSQKERIIFILTKLDLEFINNKREDNLTTSQAIDNYLQKIVTAVNNHDEFAQDMRKKVYFDWGVYEHSLFHRIGSDCLNEEEEEKQVECKKDLFEVTHKGKHFNSSYRAAVIGKEINNLANDWRHILFNPKLSVYYKTNNGKQEKENHKDNYDELCKREISVNQNIVPCHKLCDKEVMHGEIFDKNEVLIGYSNGDLIENIMTINTSKKDSLVPCEEETYALNYVLPTIKKTIHMYRYNHWLVLELIFLSATSAVYLFYLDKKNK